MSFGSFPIWSFIANNNIHEQPDSLLVDLHTNFKFILIGTIANVLNEKSYILIIIFLNIYIKQKLIVTIGYLGMSLRVTIAQFL